MHCFLKALSLAICILLCFCFVFRQFCFNMSLVVYQNSLFSMLPYVVLRFEWEVNKN